jgi:shikimate kinase
VSAGAAKPLYDRAAVVPARVYLTGFMGCGKTTLGRALAERRGVPFVDLDDAFESLSGRTVRETFETHGEPWFRAREAELLRGTADLAGAVVALGGGTFVLPENAAFVKRHGVSVFLDVPFDVIARRLGDKALDRPLFRSIEEARGLYEARLPSYRMADQTVALSGEDTVNAAVDRIERVLI